MVYSADQALRQLERQAVQNPEDKSILRALAQAYHRQGRLPDSIKALHRGGLFHENDPVANAISCDLKKLQKITLDKLGPYVSCCTWTEQKDQKEWISPKQINEETPVIVGLSIFWLSELAIFKNSEDMALWLQSLSSIFPSDDDHALLEWIASMPYLTDLSIRLEQLDDAGFQFLRSMTGLKDLELIVDQESSPLLFEDLDFLSKLRTFAFEGKIKQELISLNKLTTLQNLKLTTKANEPESLDFIFPSQLKALHIEKIDAFSRISLNSMSSNHALQSLSIDFSNSEERGMNLLSSFPNLTELSLNSIHASERLACLPNPERLKKLNLQYSPIVERHLSTLQKFQGLEEILIHEGAMSSLMIERLKRGLPLLKTLTVNSDRSPI
ncbi:MAG: tetratricopeptide repeat protein [Planctomycetota bacterium]|nr:tetratricopeptide repeat protein [Planctomycetota bacterium]